MKDKKVYPDSISSKENEYWDKYYQNKGAENVMWFSPENIKEITVEQNLPLETASFIYHKTEHSTPTLELIAPSKGMKVLEVGAGTGGFSAAYLARYKEVDFQLHAIDFSQESLKIARMRIQSLGFDRKCDFIQGDILNLPFPDESFDMIICPSVLEHIKNQEQALKEMSRACRKNGKILISTDNKKALISRLSVWRLTNAFANLLKDLKLLHRPKGYFIANNPYRFQKKLLDYGLKPQHLSFTEFGFPGFRLLIKLISRKHRLERKILPILKMIEQKSLNRSGLCHSVFITIAKKS